MLNAQRSALAGDAPRMSGKPLLRVTLLAVRTATQRIVASSGLSSDNQLNKAADGQSPTHLANRMLLHNHSSLFLFLHFFFLFYGSIISTHAQ